MDRTSCAISWLLFVLLVQKWNSNVCLKNQNLLDLRHLGNVSGWQSFRWSQNLRVCSEPQYPEICTSSILISEQLLWSELSLSVAQLGDQMSFLSCQLPLALLLYPVVASGSWPAWVTSLLHIPLPHPGVLLSLAGKDLLAKKIERIIEGKWTWTGLGSLVYKSIPVVISYALWEIC